MKTVPHLPNVDLEKRPLADVQRIAQLARVDVQKIEKLVREDYPRADAWAVALVEQAYSGYGFARGLWKKIGDDDLTIAVDELRNAEQAVEIKRAHVAALAEARGLGKLAAAGKPQTIDEALFLSHLAYVPALPEFEADLTVGGPETALEGTPGRPADASGGVPAARETSEPPTRSDVVSEAGGLVEPGPENVATGGSTLRGRVPRPVPAEVSADLGGIRLAMYVGQAESRLESATLDDGSPTDNFVGRPLEGGGAIVRKSPNEGKLLAQFNDTRTGYGYGWHEFPAGDFAVEEAPVDGPH